MISLPIGSRGVDEILSLALSESVSSFLFAQDKRVPFSNVEITGVDHPVPERWTSDVAIESGVFGKPPPLTGWNGMKVFEESLMRLGLDRSQLDQFDEASILTKFGPDKESLHRMKRTVKNELKEYDSQFKLETGKEASRADKEPMRMLYTLYRRLRDLAKDQLPKSDDSIQAANRLEALYLEKQTVRAVLQEYQARFLSEQGRRIKYHRDIVSVDREYRQYKQVKEEIAKLETQLGRRQYDDI